MGKLGGRIGGLLGGLGGLWLGLGACEGTGHGLEFQRLEEPPPGVAQLSGGWAASSVWTEAAAWPQSLPIRTPTAREGAALIRTPTAREGVVPPAPLASPPAPTLAPGELLVTELMIDPAAVPDAGGEWLELLNRSQGPVNLRGLELRDCGVDRFLVEEDFTLEPGQRVVLGAAPQGRENGGVPVDLVWEDYQLGNRRDCVVVLAGETEVDRVRWEGGWKIPVGAALQLDASAEARGDNDERRRWCRSRAYGDNHEGDRGSPGKKNHRCGRQ